MGIFLILVSQCIVKGQGYIFYGLSQRTVSIKRA